MLLGHPKEFQRDLEVDHLKDHLAGCQEEAGL